MTETIRQNALLLGDFLYEVEVYGARNQGDLVGTPLGITYEKVARNILDSMAAANRS